MKSLLFRKLASLPGINLFNLKDKVEIREVAERVEPTLEQSHAKLFKLAHKYFIRVVVQDKYIKILNRIINQYSFESDKWDTIQSNHEYEIAEIRREYEQKIKNIKNSTHKNLHDDIAQLKQENGILKIAVQRIEPKNPLVKQKPHGKI
jgi:hypothetical protein